jgi:hypothetical protein
MRLLYVAIILLQYRVVCFWVPPYTVHLEDNEEFVISAEDPISDDLEMLKEQDIRSLDLDIDDSKLGPLHRLSKKSTSPGSQGKNAKLPIQEESYSMEDLIRIWNRTKGSNLKKRDGKVLHYTIYDPNAEKHILKRSSQEGDEEYDGGLEIISKSSTPKPVEYDYESLRNDYYQEVLEALHSNTNFNYTSKNKSEETAEDAIQEILQFQQPEDKSNEAAENFAMKFIKWLFGFKNLHTKKGKIKLLKILASAAFVCLLVCVVCWCRHGLCCCCFRCSFCWPRKLINKAKKYVALNPPGVLIEGGIEKRHEPTVYEIEAYNKLRSTILSL